MKYRQNMTNQNHTTKVNNAHLSVAYALGTTVLIAATLLSMPQARAELVIEPTQQQVIIAKQKSLYGNAIINNQEIADAKSMTTPTDVSIVKLMQVMHIDEQIASIVNGRQVAMQAINTQAQSSQENNEKLNKRQRELQQQIQNVLGQYAKIMSSSIGDAVDESALTTAYINAAKMYYTQAEVDAQIGFYDSVIGQSILAKQPQITADFLKHSLPTDTSETEAQVGELMPQMKQIMKSIF